MMKRLLTIIRFHRTDEIESSVLYGTFNLRRGYRSDNRVFKLTDSKRRRVYLLLIIIAVIAERESSDHFEMAKRNSEPMGGPDPSRWYSLSLGNSFNRQNPSSKFCTLRYEFKPASIDKRQPGSLHKVKDHRVTVEFQNNQLGKPKVTFEGTSGDYSENDAVLLFDGETFVLERLHRGVKRLRHVRLLDESLAAAPPLPVASSGVAAQTNSPPPPKGSNLPSSPYRLELQLIPDGAEKIDSGHRQGIGAKLGDDNTDDHPFSYPNMSLDSNKDDSEELVDIMNVDDDDDMGSGSVEKGNISRGFDTGIDINLPHPVDMDDEVADVDVKDEAAAKGPSAAEALRAQVRAEGGGEKTSSPSTSSDSESSRSSLSRSGSSRSSPSKSGSGSSSDSDSDSGSDSSDSEDSDNVSVTSI